MVHRSAIVWGSVLLFAGVAQAADVIFERPAKAPVFPTNVIGVSSPSQIWFEQVTFDTAVGPFVRITEISFDVYRFEPEAFGDIRIVVARTQQDVDLPVWPTEFPLESIIIPGADVQADFITTDGNNDFFTITLTLEGSDRFELPVDEQFWIGIHAASFGQPWGHVDGTGGDGLRAWGRTNELVLNTVNDGLWTDDVNITLRGVTNLVPTPGVSVMALVGVSALARRRR